MAACDLARFGVTLDPRRRRRAAHRIRRRPRRRQFGAQAVEGLGGGFSPLRLGHGRLRCLDLGGQPGQGFVQSLRPRLLARLFAGERLDPVARRRHGLVEREWRDAGGLHRLLGSAEGFSSGLERGLGGFEGGLAGVDFGFQFRKAGALGQPHGGGTGRFGSLDEAVPAPQVAGDRDQTRADR